MRLKELREEKGLTQTEVATAIGGSQSNLAKWEKEKVEPTADAICKLADFFNVSTDYLLGRSDELGSVVMPAPTAPALSDDERKLLDYYSQMSHPMKIRVIAYCEGMLSTGQNAASKRNA